VAHSVVAGDPSLRLKNGYAQDDAIDKRTCHQNFKLTHYPLTSTVGQHFYPAVRMAFWQGDKSRQATRYACL
jgi:hypothetical protein